MEFNPKEQPDVMFGGENMTTCKSNFKQSNYFGG